MVNSMEELIIYVDKDIDDTEAKALADRLKVDITMSKDIIKDTDVVLSYTKEGVSLESDGQRLIGDFSYLKKRLLHNNLSHEMLIKAAKVKNIDYTPVIFDATAGMGEDSLLLAAAGFNVKMFERDIIIAALLKDTLRRAKEDDELREIVERMELIEGDSIKKMGLLGITPDVVLLDPMFPQRQKSGLVKKKFQLIHHLEKPCEDEEELLKAAIDTKAKKIVVKRPAKGPNLSGIKPSYVIEGKTIRYDCIVR